MRIFIDTNVLVSAFLGSKVCNDVLTTVLSEHELVVSDVVVTEFETVLRRKLQMTGTALKKALALVDDAEVVSPSSASIRPGITATNDLKIVLSARDAAVDLLVTGDRGILEQATNFDVPAFSPRNFLQLIEGGGDSYPTLPGEGEGPLVSEPKDNPVRDQAYTFALDIIHLYQQLQDQREFVISKQLLRSGTGIGANVEEATAAESRRDFLHKMNIASKEARETNYWLRLLRDSKLVKNVDIATHLTSSYELVKLLTAIVKTTART